LEHIQREEVSDLATCICHFAQLAAPGTDFRGAG
jgi:hypothetical protein